MDAARAVLLALTLALAARASADYSGTNVGLRPVRLVAFDRVHYFQLAEDSIGTVVFFHGCARSARNFWPFDPELCPTCIGEHPMVQALAARHMHDGNGNQHRVPSLPQVPGPPLCRLSGACEPYQAGTCAGLLRACP